MGRTLSNFIVGATTICTMVMMATVLPQASYALYRLKKFHLDALKLHNYARFLHDTTPMTLSTKLTIKANKSAARMLSTLSEESEPGGGVRKTKFEVSSSNDSSYFVLQGENTWGDKGNGNENYDDDVDLDEAISISKAITSWYSQAVEFPWDKAKFNGNESTYQEFAQMLWTTTAKMGCGWARSPEVVLIVCRYHPSSLVGTNYEYVRQHVRDRIYPNDYAPPELQASIAPEKLNVSVSDSANCKSVGGVQIC